MFINWCFCSNLLHYLLTYRIYLCISLSFPSAFPFMYLPLTFTFLFSCLLRYAHEGPSFVNDTSIPERNQLISYNLIKDHYEERWMMNSTTPWWDFHIDWIDLETWDIMWLLVDRLPWSSHSFCSIFTCLYAIKEPHLNLLTINSGLFISRNLQPLSPFVDLTRCTGATGVTELTQTTG